MSKDISNKRSKQIMDELEFEILPKMSSVENGWRLILDVYGQQVLAQAATRLIHLTLRQQNDIEALKNEIAELKNLVKNGQSK